MNKKPVFKILVRILFVLLWIVGFSVYRAEGQRLSQPASSPAAEALYQNLHILSKRYVLFGHQDDLAYGVNWKYEKGRSDIKEVVGDYPAVYGWDIGGIEHGAEKNLDGVPFEMMKTFIEEGYQRGAVITISWHLDNPLSGGSSWDTTKNTVKAVLPGGVKHEAFKIWLDRAADFLGNLTGTKGKAIPILFRPFHEQRGNWFWWGRNTTSPDDFKALWHFTVNYLCQIRKLNNLILVYNTNDFTTEEAFLEGYPGDHVVDVLSFDLYQYANQRPEAYVKTVRKQLQIVTEVAQRKNKLSAFAETGFEAVPDPVWWTKTFWPAIEGYPVSYVMVWRNAGYEKSMKKMHYYAPYDGQVSAADFKKLYRKKSLLFEKALKKKNIYQLHSK